MKFNLIIASCFISIFSFSQDINLGGGIGSDQEIGAIGLLSYAEFRPKNAKFSVNLDPSFHRAENFSLFTVPVSLKLILGNRFRICPSAGVFVRSNSNTGWITNMNFEYLVHEKTIIIAQGSLTKDFWKTDRISPGGAAYESNESSLWMWFNIGIKRIISLKKQEQTSY